MGVQTSQQPDSIHSKLKPHQEVDDPIFGPVEIFRSIQPPYDYIMKYKRRFYTQDSTYQSYSEHLKKIQSIQHKILSKIHLVCQDKETYACTKTPTICCYINYYNFTLHKAIERKRIANGSFSQADIWFLALSLIELAKYLKRQGIALGEYSSDRIYLAPDGSIRMYLLNILPENQHNPYYQILADQNQLSNYLFSPEQLYYFSIDQYQIKFDVFKSDVFVIGLVLLEMASISKIDKFYNITTKTISLSKIKQELINLKKQYSIQLVNFLSKMFIQKPNQRSDFDSLLQYVNSLQVRGNRVIRQSNGIKLSETESLANKRKKAMQNRRQQLEQQQSGIMSAITTNPTSTQSSDKFRSTGTIRKVSLLPMQNEQRAHSIKSRNFTPLRRVPQKVNTIYKPSKFSFLDDPIKLPFKRFQ